MCLRRRVLARGARANSVGRRVYDDHERSGRAAPLSLQTDQRLNVGPSLRDACGIDDVARSPKFHFDKSTLSGNDRQIASRIASCMMSGPMQGKSVSLVGRADPRGTEQDNVALGQARADAFRAHLTALGVDATRIQDSSRGALDAQ